MAIEIVEITRELRLVLSEFTGLYKVTGNKYSGFLFTNDNYIKICTIVETKLRLEDEHFLATLCTLYKILERNNLLNQANFDLILNNRTALNNEFGVLISEVFGLYWLGQRVVRLTPHILNFLLFESHEHTVREVSEDFFELRGNLRKALLLFLDTTEIGNGPASINSRFNFIVNNYRKIPQHLFETFEEIPRHQRSMKVLRDLIKILDQNISPAEHTVQLTAYITALIGHRAAQGNQVNYEQSVHNSEVEKSVSHSAAKLKELYPGVYSDALLESNLIELVDFAKSLKKTDAEKHAGAAIMRLINNPHDNQIKRSDITNKQALALTWVALHDESKYLPSVTLITAKENFIKALVNIERAYNVDENDRDRGGKSKESCPSGTFNMIIGALNTIHQDVNINFNSRELAGMRLKAIIKDEIKKYLDKYSELSAEIKDETIDKIEELNSNIISAFNANPENLRFIDVLSCLPTLTINSILHVNIKPPTLIEEAVAEAIPDLNQDSMLVRALKSIKNYFHRKFESALFNPFANVPYSGVNEDTLDHPLPHTRTLHTSFFRKMADSASVLFGSDNLKLPRDEVYRYGLLDYLTSLGLLRTAEIILFQYAKDHPRPSIMGKCAKVASILLSVLNLSIKSLVGGYVALFIFPIVVLVHIAAKIALAIETRKANKTPATDNHSNTTATLKTKFKENELRPLSKNNAIAIHVVPYIPIKPERKVLFSTNNSRDYVSADFLLTKRKDINRARSIARVKREACHELHGAQLLSYKRVKNG